jgi:DNA polymerase-3 subunit gamma/tau
MTAKYQIIARKYRPQTFKEVVGQEVIVRTLKNSIKQNRIANAYIFSGARGIGKTTLARLFAKTLNCSNLTNDIEPCNNCASCIEISSCRSLDVIEIDGASNRGIDDIRQINETTHYVPAHGKYRIYIIDEVHMLTKEAFNALLKTLEEPPSSIKFLFATTELHKVPSTIISRCQRFDLSRINIDLIIEKLNSIALDLQREVQKEALYLIAHLCEGSLRDAESLLDQIISYKDNEIITTDTVHEIIGLIPQNFFFELDEAVKNQNTLFSFDLTEKIFQSGKDFSHFTEELVEHYRNILLIKKNMQPPYLSDSLLEKYHTSALLYDEEQVLYILDLLLNLLQNLQKSPFKRVVLEMMLLKIIQSNSRLSAKTIAKKLLELEKKLSAKASLESASTNTMAHNNITNNNFACSEYHTNSSKIPLNDIPAKNNIVQNNIATNTLSKETIYEPSVTNNPIAGNQVVENSIPTTIASSEHNPSVTTSEPNDKISLAATPFDLEQPPKPQVIHPKSHYDTLLRFTAVELDGVIKKPDQN